MIYTTVQDLKGDISKILKDKNLSLPLTLTLKSTPFYSDKYKQNKAMGVYYQEKLVGYIADNRKFLLAHNHKNCEDIFNLMKGKNQEVQITLTKLDTALGHPRYWSYVKELGFIFKVLIKGDIRKYTNVKHLFQRIEKIKENNERIQMSTKEDGKSIYIYDSLGAHGEIVTKIPYNIKRALLKGERELFLNSYKQAGNNFEIEGVVL